MADTNDPTQNVTIWNNDKSKNVSTITDGSYERLAVDANANIINNESPTRYQLLSDYDATGTSINSTSDTTLFSYTGEGVLDFIAVTNATTSNYEIVINVDGTERLRISMSDLGSTIGLVGSSNEPIWTQTANKQFRYHPTPELGFTTSVSVEAKMTSGTGTVTHLVLYRERIST